VKAFQRSGETSREQDFEADGTSWCTALSAVQLQDVDAVERLLSVGFGAGGVV
jgi:hypothetical protein